MASTPYRAMFTTIVTVTLALVAVGMWIRAVEPMLAAAGAASPATQITGPETAPGTSHSPEHSLKLVVQGTLLLSFLLICLLLVVGFFATFREWVRFRMRKREGREGHKTKFVDAWKLAGERMESPGREEDEGDVQE